NGYFLPTRVTTRDPLGPVEIALEYILVNGKPALADAADPKVAAGKIREFESGWRKWREDEKIQAIRDLQEVGGPKVALVLAKKLRDPSPAVREAVVQALGDLRERAAVPFLLRALGRARKNPAFFNLVCRALGEIGDPRAVKPLAKKILSGNTKSPEWRALAQARINALSRIEAPESVDELIKLLSMAGGGGRRATSGRGKGPLYRYVQAALRKLTGQEFKFAYQWHKWWKAHRAGFFRKKR
ncbi:MAG TPA: HEAT repeat domain-containing protein, partial [Planctomycetes bacterium]|nr:HEAT repeat domain-containing protein [Planctomycetota bacterium]